MSEEEKSAAATSEVSAEIEARPRDVLEQEVQDIFGLGGDKVHKIAVRACTKGEEFSTIKAAQEWLQEFAGSTTAIKSDDDILIDLKNIHIMFIACRRAEKGDAERKYMYPAFPGPKWMKDNMTTDQLAELLNVYNAFKRHLKPDLYSFDFDRLDELIDETAINHDSDVPEVILSTVSREWLVQAFMVMARRMWELKNEHRSLIQGHNAGDSEIGGESTGEGPSSGTEGS